MIRWLAVLLSDESGSASTKRLVGILCALATVGALGVNLLHPGHPVPSADVLDAVEWMGLGALGLSSADKFTKRRTPASESAPTVQP